MTALPNLLGLFSLAGQAVPRALDGWHKRVADWIDDYSAYSPGSQPLEIAIDSAVFIFDYVGERVILAYAVATEQLVTRDDSRMRGFPDANRSIRESLGEPEFLADRGHFLGHASGGRLDINLFPHRRELNRGWSDEGKRFRELERHVAEHPGTFFYHRPVYDDDTWIPATLEYGVLVGGDKWRIERFSNKHP